MSLSVALLVALMAHFLGDFYFQSNEVARRKCTAWPFFAKHCLIYLLFMVIASVLISATWEQAIGFLVLTSVTHAVIDAAKIALQGRVRIKLAPFALDQIAHVVCLVAGAVLFSSQNPIVNLPWLLEPLFGASATLEGLALFVALLACGRPAALAVSMFMEDTKVAQASGDQGDLDARDLKAGRWIGILERTIVVMLTFVGQYEAIAFVLAAKSIARFKNFEEKNFAEKYLVGTLASIALAILMSLVLRALVSVQG